MPNENKIKTVKEIEQKYKAVESLNFCSISFTVFILFSFGIFLILYMFFNL
jgi:hypothetical protein